MPKAKTFSVYGFEITFAQTRAALRRMKKSQFTVHDITQALITAGVPEIANPEKRWGQHLIAYRATDRIFRKERANLKIVARRKGIVTWEWKKPTP